MSDTVRFESPQTKLLQEWDRGYQENNLDIIDKFLYKDFNFVLYPRSLGSRELNREEYLKTMAGVFSAGIKLYDVSHENFYSTILAEPRPQFVYHSIVEVPGKVVIHVRVPIRSDQPRIHSTCLRLFIALL